MSICAPRRRTAYPCCIQTNAAGPIVLLRLPEGHYRIEARYDGRVLVREVDVDPSGREMVYLNWSA